MPNIKHNIKIICEIHIAYRYIDPSNRHNFENCLLPWYSHQSCLGWPLAAWLAQAALREKSWKDNFQSYGLTIQSIWFSLKNPYDFFKNSYGFLLKIHKDFSEIFRFFTKTITKKKIDKKSVAPEPTTICFNLFHTVSMHINLHSWLNHQYSKIWINHHFWNKSLLF